MLRVFLAGVNVFGSLRPFLDPLYTLPTVLDVIMPFPSCSRVIRPPSRLGKLAHSARFLPTAFENACIALVDAPQIKIIRLNPPLIFPSVMDAFRSL